MLYKTSTYLNQLFAGVSDAKPKQMVLDVINKNDEHAPDGYITQNNMLIADSITLFYRLQLRPYIEHHGPWLTALQDNLPVMQDEAIDNATRYSAELFMVTNPNLMDIRFAIKKFALAYASYCAHNARKSDMEIRNAIEYKLLTNHGNIMRDNLLMFHEAWQDTMTKSMDISRIAYSLPIDKAQASRYDIEMCVNVFVQNYCRDITGCSETGCQE